MFKHSNFFMKKCSLTVDFVKYVFKWKMFEHVELDWLPNYYNSDEGVFEQQLCVSKTQARFMFLIVSCCLLAEIGHIVQYIFLWKHTCCTGHLNNRKLLIFLSVFSTGSQLFTWVHLLWIQRYRVVFPFLQTLRKTYTYIYITKI